MKRKGKGKEEESYIFIVYITFNITGGGQYFSTMNKQLLEIIIIELILMLKK